MNRRPTYSRKKYVKPTLEDRSRDVPMSERDDATMPVLLSGFDPERVERMRVGFGHGYAR